MMRWSKLGLAGLTLAGGTLVSGAPPALPFAEGEPFPSLVLPALDDGRPASVADFRGQKLVLHVFASW